MSLLSQNNPSAADGPGQKTSRIEMVDYAKGLGIVLVVIGHVLRGLGKAGIQIPSTALLLDGWIYTFHMPLFFFLSGLFIEKSLSRNTKDVLIQKVSTLLYPYIVWSTISALTVAVATKNANIATLPHDIMLAPVMQFWFLYVLFIFMLSYITLRKLKVDRKIILGLYVLFFFTGTLQLDLGSWGVTYMCRINVPYFAVGAFASSDILPLLFNGRSQRTLSLSALAALLFILVPLSAGSMETNQFNVAWAFMGIFGILSLAKYLEDFKSANIIRDLGRRSLEIFVAHVVFSALARSILQKFQVTNFEVNFIVGVAAGLAGPLFLVAIMQRLNIPYLFHAPKMSRWETLDSRRGSDPLA